MIFVSFRCFFSVFHAKCLGSVYATPTERLRYALATPFLSPCYIKRKNRPRGRFCNGHHGLYNNSHSAYLLRSMDGIFLPFQRQNCT